MLAGNTAIMIVPQKKKKQKTRTVECTEYVDGGVSDVLTALKSGAF